MNITELFIRRPVMTVLVMVGILLFGIAGYRAARQRSSKRRFPDHSDERRITGCKPRNHGSIIGDTA